MLYSVLLRMIDRGMDAGLGEKIDIFYAVGKLTQEEYTHLTSLLAEKAV